MKFLGHFLSLSALAGITLVGSAFASVHDVHFRTTKGEKQMVAANSSISTIWRNASGNVLWGVNGDEVRIRVVNPPRGTGKMGFGLTRPFLVLDGIYLGTGSRTLSEFQEEADQFGLITLLENLGYTPILVQFSSSVGRSLQDNSERFAKLLEFMNDNSLFEFKNKVQDGFVVMGISQGGVLGRYGSYLYDKNRTSADAPIRLYASLDSPHQGAILPKNLYYSLDFWASYGGSADAELFMDKINAPGSSELLLYSREEGSTVKDQNYFKIDLSPSRFLFGSYRDAATYDGFPSVLLSQGKMDGFPLLRNLFYDLSRKVEKYSVLLGRATSVTYQPFLGRDTISVNRIYKKGGTNIVSIQRGDASLDMIPGSTYPFESILYESLHNGFEDAIPSKMSYSLLGKIDIKLNTKWDRDSLTLGSSTFIPTASAMDVLCNGNLAMAESCFSTMTDKDFPFENPGQKSTGDVVFAVDRTHPRYAESGNARHIELPGTYEDLDTNVLRGMQTDIWRLLCEVAKYDYDTASKSYRNPSLSGVFDPEASCMDLSKMPDIIRNSGLVQWQKFGYARYDYNENATESDEGVSFKVPAGWHKVAAFSLGKDIPEGSVFEAEIRLDKAVGNWAKAELLLTRTKSGTGQVQLQEIEIPLDGEYHKVRWTMPSVEGALDNYQWFRLVINSDGVNVNVKSPKLAFTKSYGKKPKSLSNPTLLPGTQYTLQNWSGNVAIAPITDALGSGTGLQFMNIGDNLFVDLDGVRSLDRYRSLKVTYWPGTCQDTKVYFDSYVRGAKSLASQNVSGNFVTTTIPLKDIINTDFTFENGLSASKLFIRGTRAGEGCILKSIELR